MSAVPSFPALVTVDEYLRREEFSEEKHEYLAGEVRMMAGGTYRHSVVCANVVGELRQRLKGKPYGASESNTRVGVPPRRSFLYPDATVICGKPEFDPRDKKQMTILNPTLVVEVLSEGTGDYDRGDKFARYRDVPSLKQYVLVSTHEARVETFLRRDDGRWLFRAVTGLESSVELEAIGIAVPLTEIYERVEFQPAQDG